MLDEVKLEPCPWCDNEGVKTFHPAGCFTYWVACLDDDCQAEGPCRDTEAEAIAAWNTRPTIVTGQLEGELVEAARDVAERKSASFKARNGRSVEIQGDDGERCWIVHSDEMARLEGALANLANAQPGPSK